VCAHICSPKEKEKEIVDTEALQDGLVKKKKKSTQQIKSAVEVKNLISKSILMHDPKYQSMQRLNTFITNSSVFSLYTNEELQDCQ
jgi:hypothetical protein